MTILVSGASGVTGKHLVEQLLNFGQKVKVIVRQSAQIPESWKNNTGITIIKNNISEINTEEMRKLLEDCNAAVSCLGHNLTVKGVYGKPRQLVTDAVRLICESANGIKRDKPFKFVLMNTAGNRNIDINESVSFGEKIVLALLRLLLPPHSDNENAADYLRVNVGKHNPKIEWVVVRPDNLINEENVTEYTIRTSPERSALFNPGKTSRINVGHLMARLIADEDLWNMWKGKMPVIYNEKI